MNEKLKVLIYNPEEVAHFTKNPQSHWIDKNAPICKVNSPEEADFIISPVPLFCIESKETNNRLLYPDAKGAVETLPHWKKFEHKHVFFDISDNQTSLGGSSAIVFRCNHKEWMKGDAQNVAWFWPVDDLKDLVPIPPEGLPYDVSFHGWLSAKWRRQCVNSCQRVFKHRFDVKGHAYFYGTVAADDPRCQEMRHNYLQSLKHSKIILAPQSIPGDPPYRFYEALSAGRIPALFCTGCVLPFEKEIDWEKCCLLFPAEKSRSAGQLIKRFLDNTGEKKYREMAAYARRVWEEWLDGNKTSDRVIDVLKRIRNGTLTIDTTVPKKRGILARFFGLSSV